MAPRASWLRVCQCGPSRRCGEAGRCCWDGVVVVVVSKVGGGGDGDGDGGGGDASGGEGSGDDGGGDGRVVIVVGWWN